MAKLERRTVVLTGATRGLGKAMVTKLVESGHTVLGCGRSADLVEDLRKSHGAPHDFAIVETNSDESVRAWAQRVLKSYSAPDLLLNNAAIINRNARLWELSSAEFDPVIDINIKGVVNVIRHFLPSMIQAGRGVVVNFSSGWGRSVSPEVAPYCATKWAIEGLSKALAEELPSGLACVPLNPGIIDTEMLRSTFGEGASQYPSPDRWAERAVPFLLKLGPEDNGESLSVR